MDLNTLYHRSVECWAHRVNEVSDGQWDAPTPCREWNVRQLANHVAGEDLWTIPLLRGSTIEEVGDRFDGDVLGDTPIQACLDAARDAIGAVAEVLPTHGTVQLSYGEESMDEYVHQLAADHLVHSWDLAVATGGDAQLDTALVHEVAGWYADREDLIRGAGLVGPRCASHGDPQGELLAAYGRDPGWGPNHAGLALFSAAFGSGDVDAIMALMTEDCAFEATGPAPDGVRHEGGADVRAVWVDLFGNTPGARFTEEESFVSGDRAVLRWRFDWAGDTPGYVRGVDVMRMREGKVSEKLSYVKG